MVRTTPPRPADIAAIFPELAPLARQAVRLHPRLGTPTVHDSSIGGPLLWPAGEEWPVCTQAHPQWRLPVSLDDVRRYRDFLDSIWLRPREPGQKALTPEQRTYLDSLQTGHTASTEPNALLPVAQLYLRDIPGLTSPAGADILQVLWCPQHHEEAWIPAARLFWRNSANVGDILLDSPEPADVDHYGQFVPEPLFH